MKNSVAIGITNENRREAPELQVLLISENQRIIAATKFSAPTGLGLAAQINYRYQSMCDYRYSIKAGVFCHNSMVAGALGKGQRNPALLGSSGNTLYDVLVSPVCLRAKAGPIRARRPRFDAGIFRAAVKERLPEICGSRKRPIPIFSVDGIQKISGQ